MQRLGKANGTSVAEKINCTIMDLSRPAIAHARELAELVPLFSTSFIVGDVLAATISDRDAAGPGERSEQLGPLKRL